MKSESKKLMNYWATRKISQWQKKNDFAFWSNLTAIQRKVLTKDIKQHLIQMFELGRHSIVEEIKQIQ